MENERTRNIKLGTFVFAGLVLLVAALYLIGSKREIFSSTFNVSAKFYNVNGLMRGNNVRFAGIDVGTVKTVNIINDSSVLVVMAIEEKVKTYIRKNAIAAIGTDGLMGNKIVNINSGVGTATQIEAGDFLITLKPIETDEAMRTLSATNDNISSITIDLKKITQKINNSHALWKLLADTSTNIQINQTMSNLRLASDATVDITRDVREVIRKVKSGEGFAGALLSDSSLSVELKQVVSGLSSTGVQLESMTTELNRGIEKINKGNGAVNTILSDSTFSNNLKRSLINIDKGADNFNQTMEGLKQSFLLRRYFKKQAQEK